MNGEIFTKTDLEKRQVAALRQKGQQIDLKSDPTNAQLRKMLDEITPQIMVDAVDEMLLVQRGKELGYKLGDEQFKSVLDNIKKDNKIETDEQFQAALKQENMTMADLRRNLERQMIVSARPAERGARQDRRLRRRGAQATTRRTSSEFTTPPTVTLREILVARAGRRQRRSTSAADEAAQDEGRARFATRARRPARASRSSPPNCPTRRRRPTPA